jgi:multidrug resistance efflux pump
MPTNFPTARVCRLLATINPSYTWVKLAQRVPVRIQIDADYAGKNKLRAGTTATVTVMENHKSQHQP